MSKKAWGDRLQWGDTRVKLVKVTVNDEQKKVVTFLQENI